MQRRPVSALSCIIVHHTMTKQDFTVQDIRAMHKRRGFSDVGYHFLVGQRGAKQGRNINYAGAHTVGEKINDKRAKQGLPLVDLDYIGIGIALIGSFEKFDPPEKLITDARDAIKRIAERYKIPITRGTVYGHKAVDWTASPGLNTMKLIYEKLGI